MRGSDLIRAMGLSATAYQPVQPVSPHIRLTVIDDKASDVQCYIRQRGGLLYITFRGSNSKRDWKTNLAFSKMGIPYGNHRSKIRVHKGFITAYKSPGVRGVLHQMMTPHIYKIRVTGHSLGAALATLCAVDLQYNFPDRSFEVMLFGAPRVGNAAFRDSYNRRVFKTMRVVYGNDMVTKLPFALLGYRHVGMPIHIGPPEVPGIFSALDHLPSRYYAELFKKIYSI